jgi:hypothetical protein
MRAENVQSGFVFPKVVTFSATLPNDMRYNLHPFPAPLAFAIDTPTP